MKKNFIKIGLATLLLLTFSSSVSASTTNSDSTKIKPTACSAPNTYCWEFY